MPKPRTEPKDKRQLQDPRKHALSKTLKAHSQFLALLPFNLSRLHHRTPHTAQVGLELEQSGSEAAQQSLSGGSREVVEEDWGLAVV